MEPTKTDVFFGVFREGFGFTEIKTLLEPDPILLSQARTMAFCALAFGELFHMMGVSAGKRSFVQVFRNKNGMMALAFAVGVLLQIAVVQITPVGAIFSTSSLGLTQWIVTAGLALLPLIFHEIGVLVRFIKKK